MDTSLLKILWNVLHNSLYITSSSGKEQIKYVNLSNTDNTSISIKRFEQIQLIFSEAN
jgi:hypothetical protein